MSDPSLFVLSLPFLGIQSIWSTMMAFAPPYLISLGIPRGVMSLVLLAAPLSGLVVQPIVGAFADTSPSKYGRRRPYMLGGCVIAGTSMLLIGYGAATVGAIFGRDSVTGKAITITLAIIAVYTTDFSTNAVMSADRALLVDVLPPERQASANAYASTMVGLGQISGFLVGSLSLPEILPWLGNTQIQGVAALTTISLLVTHTITAYRVTEKPYVSLSPYNEQSRSPSFILARLWKTFQHLPPVTHKVLEVQFWSWLSQFPSVLFTTIYIGDLFRLEHAEYDSDAPMRAGSRTLFYEALVFLASIIILPLALQSRVLRARNGTVLLSGVWAMSQAVSAFVMLSVPLAGTVQSATILFSFNGFCTAVNHWVPFAIVGEAIILDARGRASVRSDDSEELDEPLLHSQSSIKSTPAGSGATMGILNMFICIPQFIVIGLSSILFAILDPHRTVQPSPTLNGTSTALVILLRLAGLCGIIACYFGIQVMRLVQTSHDGSVVSRILGDEALAMQDSQDSLHDI